MKHNPKYHYRGNPCIRCGSDLRYNRGDRCVQCHKNRNTKWRQENQDSNYHKIWYTNKPGKHTEHGRNWVLNNSEKYSLMQSQWRYKNHEKILAHRAVKTAVDSNDIPNVKDLQCADQGPFCRGGAIHYHHESYEEQHWLDVVPLCGSCHAKRHSNGVTNGL